jgi:cytochrome b
MSTRQAKPTRRGASRTRKLWIVDATLFVAFLSVMNLPLTGIAVHEWLGMAIAAGLIVHLVQHGNWLATLTKRFRSATSFRNRLNYLMTGLLFFAFVSIILSGLVISEAALPWLGIGTAPSVFWVWLHLISVDLVLLLTALHLALNWGWIVTSVDRFVVKPVQARLIRRRPGLRDVATKEIS